MTEGAAGYESPSLSDLARTLRLETPDQAELTRLSGLLDDPTLQVLERDAPIDASVLASVPDWARGGARAETVGPFSRSDGVPVWFDFLRLVRLVPVFLAGGTQPAVLFSIRELPLRLGDPVPVRDVLRLLQRRYTLGAGSVWIRADLLAGGAPSDAYVGLLITEGHITFTPPPTDAGGRLTMPAGGRCALELTFDPPAVTATATTAGKDAADAVLQVPATATFVLGGHVDETSVADARWQLFGQTVEFRWEKVPARYEPDLHSVLVPMTASVAEVEPVTVVSPLAGLAGAAPIARAGWLLPVAAIDVTKPPAASGAGGLGVLAGNGLRMTWAGLEGGPVGLPAPWVVLLPGVAGVVDAHAGNIYAQQRFELWADALSRFRSEVEVRYTDAFPVTFVSSASGTDVVITAGSVDARLDRPVDVRGTPLSIHTVASQLILATTGAPGTDPVSTLHIRDVDILNDALQLAATPIEPGGSTSLAIRNALFTTTPVATFALAGDLLQPDVVDQGTVTLGFGLYGVLPTLPDPYAANVGWLLASPYTRARVAQVVELLTAAVAWTRAADDEAADDVVTSFTFAPVGNLADMFQRWSLARVRPVAGRPARDMTSSIAVAAASIDAPNVQALAFVDGRQQADATWHGFFDAFEREQFALLDVSSNADQMGVSFAWKSRREVDERSPVAREVLTSDPNANPDDFPLQVHDLDLSAQSRFVRAFTVPQISWEPLVNLTAPDPGSADPPVGFVLFPDDGGPTRLFNDATAIVPIAPIPVVEHLESDFHERAKGFTGGLFTLPFGLRAFAEFSRTNQFTGRTDTGAKLAFNARRFSGGALVGGLQLRVDAPTNLPEGAIFRGATVQLANLLYPNGAPTGTGALGESVGEVFNDEFFLDPPGVRDRGVPVTRIDFSGYGASLFSHWDNPNAVVAATSQAHFDVFVGRTAHEVIQIRSLLYPWGVRVVRTITMFRGSNGYTFRYDSGWQAESPGLYDFRYKAYGPGSPRPVIDMPSPYTFHPGLVHGVFNVRNIHETAAVADFTETWTKQNGDTYLDANSVLKVVDPTTPASDRTRSVHLQPVYFDADVEIEGVTTGASGGRVPSKGMLGYVQLAPRGEPLPAALFAKLLLSQFGSLGGPVDCGIDVAASGQTMRLSRADVSPATDASGNLIFVGSARGAVTLPKDGSWSVVQHEQGTGAVSPLDPQVPVPVVRRGILNVATGTTDTTAADLVRLANPADLVAALTGSSRNYGLLQSTGTQKALFRLPAFSQGDDSLHSLAPDFADAYRIVNSTAVFPNVADAVPLVLGSFATKIIKEGYKLVDALQPDKVFEQALPRGPLFLINESFLKLYVEYAPTDKDGNKLGDGSVRFGLDSSAAAAGDKWLSKVSNIGMVVDLGSMARVMTIRGKFDAANGSQPGFIEPELVFSDALQPVIDILQVLLALSTGDYADAMKKGLDVAMSNSADSWNYAFHARQEIPVVKFPPEPEYSTSAVDPLKLEAHLAIGVYFNEAMQVTSDPGQLVPSAGAFLEFGGSLSVMCVSLAAATVYATGSVDLITAADIKTGPSLHMKFGFGCELVVGLPVVGGVTVTYMVGVQIDLDTGSITVGGFLLFRGRAELLAGLVTVQIQIEAKGSVKRTFGSDSTELMAQVTFGLDISIFLVINISFSQSWEESRQIA